MSYSTDLGRHWSYPYYVGEGECPSLSVYRDTLLIAWCERNTMGDGYRIWYGRPDTFTCIFEVPFDTVPESDIPERTHYHTGGGVCLWENSLVWEDRRGDFQPQGYWFSYSKLYYYSPPDTPMVLGRAFRSTGTPYLPPFSPSLGYFKTERRAGWDPFEKEIRVYVDTVPYVVDTGDVWGINASSDGISWVKDSVIYSARFYIFPPFVSSPYRVVPGDMPVRVDGFIVYRGLDEGIKLISDGLASKEISISSGEGFYPQGVFVGDTLVCVWTEGEGPYYIVSKRIVPSSSSPVYVDNLGFSTPSVFNIYRDTFFNFGDEFYESMDAGFDSLAYEIPYLSPESDYRLRLYFYNPWDERMILRIFVDGRPRGAVKVDSGEVMIWERRLPRRVFRDSVVALRIGRLRGAYAVLSGFEIYEGRRRPGGIQTENSRGVYEYFLSVPSIVSWKGYLRFGIPEAGEVKIGIYDVLGRRRYMLSSRFNPGIHRIPLPLSRMPQGIYFILFEYKEHKEKKKIMVIR